MIVEVIGEVIMPLLLSNIIDKGVIGGRGISYIVTMGIIMIVTALFMMTAVWEEPILQLKHPRDLPTI